MAAIPRYAPANVPNNRFAPTVVASNPIRRVSSAEAAAIKAKEAAQAAKAKDRTIAGARVDEPQYSLDVTISSEDQATIRANKQVTFSDSLYNPTAGLTYQIRAAVLQHNGSARLFQGVTLKWDLPAGWTWADDLDAETDHEFVSNPLVIARLATYGSGEAGWRVTITGWYQ